MPAPGTMLGVSPAYMPVMMKGLKVNPDNPLLFDFIMDTGKSGMKTDSQDFKAESEKLIKYFLASLTIKENDLWVNLSPYEKDRMITDELGTTELGRDMLAQDYVLKQLTASMIYPENDLGKEFWAKVYAQAQEQFGTTDIPTNTFNKVWITADKAKILERNNTGYVVGAHLKVMLEADYVAQTATEPGSGQTKMTSPEPGSEPVLRAIILPAIEQEVNEGQNFANLRQMFYAMILSTWYKQALKDTLLNQVYSNKGKTSGVQSDDPAIKEKIYAQYLEAYKKGVFSYIKEDVSQATGETTPRKYFSGGLQMNITLDRAQTLSAGDNAEVVGVMADVMTTINNADASMADAEGKIIGLESTRDDAQTVQSKMTLDDVNWDAYKGKTVAVRVDFNVPVKDGVIKKTDESRIQASLETINLLVSKGVKVVLTSHLGKGDAKDTLAPVAVRLQELMGKQVIFNKDFTTAQAAKGAIDGMKPGDVLLLENVRFNKEETSEDAGVRREFAKKLFAGIDLFVLDGFSVAHREQASVTGATGLNIPSIAGKLVEKEIVGLERAQDADLLVMGGIKVSDKIKIIEKMLLKNRDLKVLIGGGMANAFFVAQGGAVSAGEVGVDEKEVLIATKLLENSDFKNRIILRQDAVIASKFGEDAETRVVDFYAADGKLIVDAIPEGWIVVDIGPKTSQLFEETILESKVVFGNFVMGAFDKLSFAQEGTKAVAEAFKEATVSGVFTSVGGGDTVAAAKKYGVEEKDISYMSMAGGATLEYLETDGDLPGTNALSDKFDAAQKSAEEIIADFKYIAPEGKVISYPLDEATPAAVTSIVAASGYAQEIQANPMVMAKLFLIYEHAPKGAEAGQVEAYIPMFFNHDFDTVPVFARGETVPGASWASFFDFADPDPVRTRNTTSILPYIKFAVERGLANLEIPFDYLPFDPLTRTAGEFSDKELAWIKAVCEANGLTMTVHSPLVGPLNQKTGYKQLFEETMDNMGFMRAQIIAAGKMGARGMVVHLASFDRVEEYADLVLFAYENAPGLKIGLENYPDKNKVFPKSQPFMDVFLRVVKAVHAKDPEALHHLGIVLDTAHYNLAKEDPIVSAYVIDKNLERLSVEYGINKKEFLLALHGNENIGPIKFYTGFSADLHSNASWEGPIHNAGVIAALKLMGYDPIVTLEQFGRATDQNMDLFRSAQNMVQERERSEVEAKGRILLDGFNGQYAYFTGKPGDDSYTAYSLFIGLVGKEEFEKHMLRKTYQVLLTLTTQDEWNALAAAGLIPEGVHIERRQPGDQIIEQGQTVSLDNKNAEVLYLVLNGGVHGKILNGTEIEFDIPSGKIFGEMALINNAPRVATITAKEGTVLVVFTKAAVDAIRKHMADFDKLLIAMTKARGEENSVKLAQAVKKDVPVIPSMKDLKEGDSFSAIPGMLYLRFDKGNPPEQRRINNKNGLPALSILSWMEKREGGKEVTVHQLSSLFDKAIKIKSPIVIEEAGDQLKRSWSDILNMMTEQGLIRMGTDNSQANNIPQIPSLESFKQEDVRYMPWHEPNDPFYPQVFRKLISGGKEYLLKSYNIEKTEDGKFITGTVHELSCLSHPWGGFVELREDVGGRSDRLWTEIIGMMLKKNLVRFYDADMPINWSDVIRGVKRTDTVLYVDRTDVHVSQYKFWMGETPCQLNTRFNEQKKKVERELKFGFKGNEKSIVVEDTTFKRSFNWVVYKMFQTGQARFNVKANRFESTDAAERVDAAEDVSLPVVLKKADAMLMEFEEFNSETRGMRYSLKVEQGFLLAMIIGKKGPEEILKVMDTVNEAVSKKGMRYSIEAVVQFVIAMMIGNKTASDVLQMAYRLQELRYGYDMETVAGFVVAMVAGKKTPKEIVQMISVMEDKDVNRILIPVYVMAQAIGSKSQEDISRMPQDIDAYLERRLSKFLLQEDALLVMAMSVLGKDMKALMDQVDQVRDILGEEIHPINLYDTQELLGFTMAVKLLQDVDASQVGDLKVNGGIDLNAKNMGLDVDKNGKGIEMNFDPVMVEQFRRGDFSGVVPVILKITPIQGPLQLLGLDASGQGKTAVRGV